MGEGDLKLGIQNEPSVMEDLFESIVGAIFIDSDMNMQAVIKAVSGMLDMSVYTDRQKISQSAKNALQEWCADKKRKLPPPVYKTVSESGPDHKKTYERACYIGERICGVGKGKNQKLADAEAARAALEFLMNEEAKQTRKKEESANDSALQKLKEIAVGKKIPSPEFRDLGESEKSTPSAKEYVIECRFSGVSAIATASEKREAKLKSAAAVLKAIQGNGTQKKSAASPKPSCAKKSKGCVAKTKKTKTGASNK